MSLLTFWALELKPGCVWLCVGGGFIWGVAVWEGCRLGGQMGADSGGDGKGPL